MLLSSVQKEMQSLNEVENILSAKVLIYALCNSVLRHGNTTVQLASPAIALMLSLLGFTPELQLPTGEDAKNLQHGCIDCIALFSIAPLSSQVEHSSDLLERVAKLCTADETQPLQAKICAANILLSVAKMAAPGILPKVLCIIVHYSVNHWHLLEYSVQHALLQALFVSVFRQEELKQASCLDRVPYLFELSMQALSSKASFVRFSGLKLLGALLSAAPDTLFPTNSQDGSDRLSKTISVLSGIANMDTAQEVRSMASQLVAAFEGKQS